MNSKLENCLQEGRQALKEEKYDKAIEKYTQAISMDNANPQNYYNRGFAYIYSNMPHMALEDFTKAVLLKKDANYYSAVGVALYYLGEYEKSIEECKKALELDSNLAGARYNLAMSYTMKGLDELAIAELKKAVDLGFLPAKKMLKESFDINY